MAIKKLLSNIIHNFRQSSSSAESPSLSPNRYSFLNENTNTDMTTSEESAPTSSDPSYGATAAAPVAVAVAAPNVQVVAPATLPAGYTFDASYDGTTFAVVVPEGGVKAGDRFVVPFAPAAVPVVEEATPMLGDKAGNAQQHHGNIPTGIWRDGLCACCSLGACHPVLWNAWCFAPFLVGQLLTRMKMTWLGKREADEAWRRSFRNLVLVWFIFYVTNSWTSLPMAVLDESAEDLADAAEDPLAYSNYEHLSYTDKIKYNINSWTYSLFGMYMFYVVVQLRATLRNVYHIPEESCLCCYQCSGSNPRDGVCGGEDSKICTAKVPVGWEDICCAIWCQCCVVAQMARHTADYRQKRAVCCNDVGVAGWQDDEAYEGAEAGIGEGSVLVV